MWTSDKSVSATVLMTRDGVDIASGLTSSISEVARVLDPLDYSRSNLAHAVCHRDPTCWTYLNSNVDCHRN